MSPPSMVGGWAGLGCARYQARSHERSGGDQLWAMVGKPNQLVRRLRSLSFIAIKVSSSSLRKHSCHQCSH